MISPVPGGRRRAPRVLAAVLLPGLLVSACGEAGPGRPGAGWDGVGLQVIEGATVFPSPWTPPIEDGVVVILDGVIEAVGERGRVQVPPGADRWPARGLSVLPGFWNAHVRLDRELLALAEEGAAEELERALVERFLRYGFTAVVETSRPGAADLARIEALQRRIAAGEVAGPEILVLTDPGAVGIHLPGPGPTPWDGAVLADLAVSGEALVPALSRLGAELAEAYGATPGLMEARMDEALSSLGAFVRAGGRLVFGTGAGYVPQYDPFVEFLLLEEADVPFEALLEALGPEPARRLDAGWVGEMEPGMIADLVVVEGDPEVDAGALGRVRRVLRAGRVVFDAGAPGGP